MNPILIFPPAALGLALLLPAVPMPGQVLAAQERPVIHLSLPSLQQAAVRTDTRALIPGLLQRQAELQQRSIASERSPRLTLQASAQYLSDVTTFPGTTPGGTAFPAPYHDQYDVGLSVRMPIIDPSIGNRASVALASNAVERAKVQTTLWQRRQLVNNAFFAIVRIDDELAALAAAGADLAARRDVARRRVAEGEALPSEELLLRAELLRLADSGDEALAIRSAQFQILELLTGDSIPADASIRPIVPDLASQVSRARQEPDSVRLRPEYQEFSASRKLIDVRSNIASAATQPRLSAFANGGYGRPGLNPLSRDFNDYYRVGVQVEWSPWDWGSTQRLKSGLRIDEQVIQGNEAAFTEYLKRATAGDLAAIDHLEQSLTTDDSIVALRTAILAEARQRHDEGVITAAQYVDRETDLTRARLQKARHRAQLGELRASFLTTLGLEVQ